MVYNRSNVIVQWCYDVTYPLVEHIGSSLSAVDCCVRYHHQHLMQAYMTRNKKITIPHHIWASICCIDGDSMWCSYVSASSRYLVIAAEPSLCDRDDQSPTKQYASTCNCIYDIIETSESQSQQQWWCICVAYQFFREISFLQCSDNTACCSNSFIHITCPYQRAHTTCIKMMSCNVTLQCGCVPSCHDSCASSSRSDNSFDGTICGLHAANRNAAAPTDDL